MPAGANVLSRYIVISAHHDNIFWFGRVCDYEVSILLERKNI